MGGWVKGWGWVGIIRPHSCIQLGCMPGNGVRYYWGVWIMEQVVNRVVPFKDGAAVAEYVREKLQRETRVETTMLVALRAGAFRKLSEVA